MCPRISKGNAVKDPMLPTILSNLVVWTVLITIRAREVGPRILGEVTTRNELLQPLSKNCICLCFDSSFFPRGAYCSIVCPFVLSWLSLAAVLVFVFLIYSKSAGWLPLDCVLRVASRLVSLGFWFVSYLAIWLRIPGGGLF